MEISDVCWGRKTQTNGVQLGLTRFNSATADVISDRLPQVLQTWFWDLQV